MLVGSLLAPLVAVPAASALAVTVPTASVTVAVSPAVVHRDQVYTVKITTTYTKRVVTGSAYLVAFLQYSGAACKANARAEHALPPQMWSLDFAGKVRGSRFTRVDSWRATGITGTRRACAYLYPEKVSPTSGVRPIAVASAAFRNV
jgi:hypothetical protein